MRNPREFALLTLHPVSRLTMQFFIVILVLCSLMLAHSWRGGVRSRAGSRIGRQRINMCDDSAPSDTDSSSDAEWAEVVMDSPPKMFLLGNSKSLSRGEVNEYVLALEKVNPTSDPTYSSLLNGVWEVISTGFGDPALLGYQAIKAASKFGVVDASDIELTITSIQPRVTAKSTVSVGPANLDIEVTTDLEVVNGSKIKENYVSAKLNNMDLPIGSMGSFSREVIITYLDQELCISRDEFGSPEILRRKGSPSPPSY
jgi:hypothetical protein